MLKFGIVSQTDPATCRVRVQYQDNEGIESYWLAVTQRQAYGTRDYHMPEIGEQVACLIDEHNEEGVVLGGIYSAADPTPVASQDKRHVAFKDGAQFEYDVASHRATVSLPGGQVRLSVGADGAVEIGGAAVIVVHGDCDIDSRSVLRLRAQTRIETYTSDSRSFPYAPASLPSD